MSLKVRGNEKNGLGKGFHDGADAWAMFLIEHEWCDLRLWREGHRTGEWL